jgi:hypothetical protein
MSHEHSPGERWRRSHLVQFASVSEQVEIEKLKAKLGIR